MFLVCSREFKIRRFSSQRGILFNAEPSDSISKKIHDIRRKDINCIFKISNKVLLLENSDVKSIYKLKRCGLWNVDDSQLLLKGI